MSNQDNHDISNIQVPDSFIQEILEQTQPLKEAREEVHPQVPQAPTQPQVAVSEDNQIVELLSLLFEQVSSLNNRLNSIQESINEITNAGMGGTFQKFSLGSDDRPSKHSERDVQAELEGKSRKRRKQQESSSDSLTALLTRRMRK